MQEAFLHYYSFIISSSNGINKKVSLIEYFHSKNYLHRDIKHENFVIGKNLNSNLIYIIDYGLAKEYCDPLTKKHIPYREGKKLTGTARYASLNTLMGVEQSRRDDVECLMFCLIYFIKGSLPWQGINVKTKKEKYDKILEMKIKFSIEELCKDIPGFII